MTREESIIWLESLKTVIGQHQYRNLWNYEQALAETIELLQSDRIVELPCKLGQTVYDVVLCVDDIYRIYEMKIAAIKPFGSLYESKYFPDFLWNIYLTDDYSYAYRTFDDIGKKTFFSKEEAETRLNELKKEKSLF